MRTAVSARCAGACPLRRTYTREEQPPTEREEKARGFPPKEAKKDTKQESIRKKVHLFLSIITTVRRKYEIISQKLLLFETKDLSLRLNKHNFPFSRRTAASI